jgi:hypothetical protein
MASIGICLPAMLNFGGSARIWHKNTLLQHGMMKWNLDYE